MTNIAMEAMAHRNRWFTWVYLLIAWWFSMAMLNNQKVHIVELSLALRWSSTNLISGMAQNYGPSLDDFNVVEKYYRTNYVALAFCGSPEWLEGVIMCYIFKCHCIHCILHVSWLNFDYPMLGLPLLKKYVFLNETTLFYAKGTHS